MVTTSLQARQKELGSYIVKGFPKLGLPGWPLRSAAAVCGNATQENLCRPVTLGAKDHGSDGIMQWRLTRLTNMQAYCNKNFGRWDTLEAQAAFTMFEMKTLYPALYQKLLSGKNSLADLTEEICWDFERPAKQYANVGYIPGVGHGNPGRINFAYDSQSVINQIGAVPSTQKTAAVAVAAVSGTAVVAGTAHAGFGAPGWVTALIIFVGLVGVVAIAVRFFGAKYLKPDLGTPPAPPTNGAVQ